MKNSCTSLLLAIALSSPALALKRTQDKNQDEAQVNLHCENEFPTTSFIAEEKDDQLIVDIVHHNGVEYTPFRNALITPNDIPYITKQAETFLKLSPKMTFRWKRSGCKAESPFFFECFGEAEDTVVNGIKVSPSYITVTETTEKTVISTYKKRSITVNFSIDGVNHSITNNFYENDCRKN